MGTGAGRQRFALLGEGAGAVYWKELSTDLHFTAVTN